MMGLSRTAMLLMLAAGQVCGQPVATFSASVDAPEPVKRIFVPPPLQWDQSMSGFRPALHQTAADFSNLTDGIAFGMSPVALNARLPEPYSGMSWNALPMANEYPGEVRYFGIPIAGAGALRMGAAACIGAGSYLIFLFSLRGLFRLSYRLTADKDCTDTSEAAREIFGRYVTIGQIVALGVHYSIAKTEVVDVTDPTAGYLIPIRWRKVGN
jgi:hypothetical protein